MLKRLLGISVILVLLAACSDADESPASTPVVVIKEIVVTATQTPVPTKTPSPRLVSSPTKIPTPIPTSTLLLTARITKITDGDTFWVIFDSGNREKIRILGVDAPETYSSNSPNEYDGITDTECLDDWGNSAAEFAIDTLSGKIVQVIADPSGDERDSFDRLLAYIHVDGQDFSSMLVKNGFGRVYRKYDYSRKSVYLALEGIAKLNKVGLWGCTSSMLE